MSNHPELASKRSSLTTKALRKIREMLTSPYGVAAIASLSFHGILFAAMPRFSSASFAAFSEDSAAAEPRTVPLVTLTPAEQGRLPDFNRPQLPAIPDISSRPPTINSLPNASTLNRPNVPNIFNRSNSQITTPSFSRPSLLNRNRPFRNPYIPRPNLSIRNTPSRSEQSSDRRTAAITNIPAPPPSVIVNPETDPEQSASNLEPDQQQPPAAETPETPAGLPELPEQSEQPSEPEDETPEIAANPGSDSQPSRLERLQAKFNYDPTNTTPEEVEANYQAWVTPAEEEEEAELTIAIAEIGELNLEAKSNLCAANPPMNGEVGVLVAPDGTPSNPTVLRSTGYEYLNQAAIDTLMNSEFPETETAVRYPFEVIVNYDAETCKSAEEILETVRTNQQEAAAEDSQAPQEP
ncbi:gram-negative bacterial tonb protein [Leptolyngbya sp. Heron Island J]|uniref:energy transducer TonB n=1 Tax=Leptolyngbya sp. Heron Island J TaxID=1385935 RepID=UPI0003B973D9|nr:energy transducer TonB [Leptolyngbya sp. Heron Island J]ESA35261.1 gram-negative bacterial tonb protein [Leptolyngbya sp. Heron Island J]